ncbi:hypothetical protein PIROE2DRAFT_18007 [Piromyces sp. E2]|nr:hypothetical protein PIROE2DRAFT_18007 [Piromyces sp. E2]|eukprot:OUM57107.1 hypothetical protein PIROE2DRAFT_18007 [Piromyces sp. E2]
MTEILPIKNYGLILSLRGAFDEFTTISNNYTAEYVGTEIMFNILMKYHVDISHKNKEDKNALIYERDIHNEYMVDRLI